MSNSTATEKTMEVNRPSTNITNNKKACKAASDEETDNGTGRFFPLHPLFALAMLPLMPSTLFLNRGFTQWFHWGFVFYLVTGQQLDFWRRFLIIQGGAVSAGWYTAVMHDYLMHSRFCHLLYNQMPMAMKTLMLTNAHLASGGIIVDNAAAVATLVSSHIIDFVAHPFLAYIIWKMHVSRGGTLRTLLTWDVMAATYALSRVYSMTHQYINRGAIDGLFYYGYDVYKIDTLDSYTAAYVGEAVFYSCLVCYKLYLQWNMNRLRLKIRVVGGARRQRSKMQQNQERKPLLMQSSSCFSSTLEDEYDDDDEDRAC